jgi:hypothetical protein
VNQLHCQWHGKFTGERTACCIHHRELDRKPSPPIFTIDEVMMMFRNLGLDVECGTCMSIAFTGYGTGEHTCQKK